MSAEFSDGSLGRKKRARFFTLISDNGRVAYLDYEMDTSTPERALRFLQSTDLPLAPNKQPSVEEFSGFEPLSVESQSPAPGVFFALDQVTLDNVHDVQLDVKLLPVNGTEVRIANCINYLEITGPLTEQIGITLDGLDFKSKSVRYLSPSFHTFEEGRRAAELQVVLEAACGRRAVLSTSYRVGGRDLSLAHLIENFAASPPPKGHALVVSADNFLLDFGSQMYDDQKFVHYKGE